MIKKAKSQNFHKTITDNFRVHYARDKLLKNFEKKTVRWFGQF